METMSFNNGYLEIAIGCMFSGKTSWLLDIHKKFTYCQSNVVVINHSDDTRYDNTMLSTHDQVKIPCIQMSSFKDIPSETLNKILEADIVLINEGQFFESLMSFVIVLLNRNKMIYVSGLDGDFRQQKFGEILDLIPLCDKITKLHALCSICKNGNPAIFSYRVNDDTKQKVIGSDNYIPLCRRCLNEKTHRQETSK